MNNKEDVPEIIQEAFPDSPGVRPGPQAGPLRTYNVVIPPSYLYHLSAVYQATYAVGVENERLRLLLRQKQMAEEAYSRSLAVANDCICTIGKSGMLLPILNRTVQMACYGIPEPPLNAPPVYHVLFSKAGYPLYLTEKEFFNDNILISKIQSLPGVEVTVRKTVKATATLLRMAISKDILTIPISIYAGWTAEGEGNFDFTTFSPFRPISRADLL